MPYKIDFPEPETAIKWTLIDDGVTREAVTYRPRFYVAAMNGNDLDRVRNGLRDHPDVTSIATESHRPGWRHGETEMLAVEVTDLDTVTRLAASVARIGRPGDYRCFNVDLSRQFRFCLETGADPTPQRDPTVLRMQTPATTFADGLDQVTVTVPSGEDQLVEGEPASIAECVNDIVCDVDPDVLSLSASQLIPKLFEASDSRDYQLGRDAGYTKLAGKSTFGSYGRVGHSPARFNLPGRTIVDESNTFFLKEANLDGIIDLVERSHKPLQESAWASIGNILTAIQIREAMSRDVLVPWRAWRPEFYKTARTLDEADRGGFTFAPRVGLHEEVHELDFSSLYPNIMCTRNLSPETVCCDCHPEREDVPGLPYSICPDDGYLPDVLQPLIDDRDEIKAAIQRTDDPEELRVLEGKSSAIKWILVACFGYQGFNGAKYGRIECHEAINAFAREIMLEAKAHFERCGWRVVHGIVDSLWVKAMEDKEQQPLDETASEITEQVGIRLEYEAEYDWIAFCPRRNDDAGALTRYFGKVAGKPVDDETSYKRRGIEARQRSTPPYVEDVQLDLIQELGRTRSPEAVCDRLRRHISDLRNGNVQPSQLAMKNRVSKRVENYTQTTKNVAALERAADLGLEKNPGQDVEYVVVDDEKRGRARVCLLHEKPDGYDIEFYTDLLIRVTESILSPLQFREQDIRQYFADRVDASITGYVS